MGRKRKRRARSARVPAPPVAARAPERPARSWVCAAVLLALTTLGFHGRSRMGYRGFPGDGHAATYWARGRFEPLPARPEAFGGPALDLYRPDLETLRRAFPHR